MPSEFRSVTPRIFVDDVDGQVRFLREVFGGVGGWSRGGRRKFASVIRS